MSNVKYVTRAAEPFLAVLRNVEPDQMDARTPCTEYDVRKLVNHLLFWGPSLEAAARKESVLPPGQTDGDLDLIEDDWAAALEALVDRTVAAWSEPDAWEGNTPMGPMELPAPLVGGMLVGELVVHGWDLARATGQQLALDDEDLLEYLHGEVTKSAEQGRAMGVYGPEVAVPSSASTLDRLLGLTGRDPAWTP